MDLPQKHGRGELALPDKLQNVTCCPLDCPPSKWQNQAVQDLYKTFIYALKEWKIRSLCLIQIVIMAAERVICVSNKMPSGGPVCFISSPAQRYASDVFCLLETFTKKSHKCKDIFEQCKNKNQCGFLQMGQYYKLHMNSQPVNYKLKLVHLNYRNKCGEATHIEWVLTSAVEVK